MSPKKWQLISAKDVSPSKWFPIEERTYRLPTGKIVDDFTVTTLADVAMIVPITKDRKVVLVEQFKPGVGEVILQFPAGRKEATHKDFVETACHELEEETGIRVPQSDFIYFAKLNGFNTKASEVVYVYFVKDVEHNARQKLDLTEDIEVVTIDFQTMDTYIFDGTIWDSQTIAAWELAKKHFPEVFK
jgi:8-oxo-dGTP pyrophosphatase MutT (NUDIX family)